MEEQLEEFWGIVIAGMTYRVSMNTMNAIRAGIAELSPADISLIPRMMRVNDIFGAIVYLDLKAISSIFESTPETREQEAKHTKELNQAEGF